MGYYTDFEITVTGLESEDQAEFFEFKFNKAINYSFDTLGIAKDDQDSTKYKATFEIREAKWYSCEEDLTKLSSSFPDTTIDVEGKGEEQGDQWKARFRNGEFERVNAQITYPDFKKLT